MSKTYTPEEQAANRAKWVAALRSGEFPQGRRRLKSVSGGLCCLGVACEVAAREGVGNWVDLTFWADSDHNASVPPTPVLEWLGLPKDNGPLSTDIQYKHGDWADCLTELNDDAGYTFDQIADLIEADGIKLADR